MPTSTIVVDYNGDLKLEVGVNRSISFVYRNSTPESIYAVRRDPGNSKEPSVEIPLQRWVRWLKLESGVRDQIQDLLRGNYVEAKLHLGGLMYFILSSEFRCVQFRQHYIRVQNGQKMVHATRFGVSMSFAEFYFLLCNVEEFCAKIPQLQHVVPCYRRRQHGEGCRECYPFKSFASVDQW